ncbi:hypothetical protein [Chlorogloea sp. CCALA 695]|uniref:hypothetical protein n=1 Tax=Chlorogloea sp. CCALA 695 TaxID=2107693 RepID=UPI000D0692A1|nr:hypothetical protein [Chlorogloea sp. CCALA 695]PSB25275.1 hypothetical protein C7B70_24955 [Chlorogloea sp. CCALA 695]
METIEVHNIYTLYEIEVDGTEVETPILGFSRPQDWGDSSRWHYHQCRVQFSYGGTVYINNCHLWQNVERNSVEAFQCIASYLFMVMMPGRIEQLAGKEFLDEDDFWDEAWGEIPPYYESDEEDYDY